MEVLTVGVSARGNWTFVRLRSNTGLSGLGEASQGYGFTSASRADDARMRARLEALFPKLEGRSPFDREAFRAEAWEQAKVDGLADVTAYSALEQAMCDLAGKAAGLPAYDLFGGRLRETIPVYANINRAAEERTPEEFARLAAAATGQGFTAVKAAVFDDYPSAAGRHEQAAAFALGVQRLEAMRRAIGERIELMVDCHSRFEPDFAVEAAQQLEPLDLAWYEEPIDPARVEETATIRAAIEQRVAGGEILFGREAFEPLCSRRAVDVVMPDVKHCGGAGELKKIAALAETFGVEVSPHSPSGPVSLAAGAHVCAGLPNFRRMEHAWGEASWRASLLQPAERFVDGSLVLNDGGGWGVELDESVLHSVLQLG